MFTMRLFTMLQHVLWRGSTRDIKDAALARLVLRTSGTAATRIFKFSLRVVTCMTVFKLNRYKKYSFLDSTAVAVIFRFGF